MLKSINNRYLLFGLILYFILVFRVDAEFIDIYLFNIAMLLIYYFILTYQFSKPVGYCTSKSLGLIVFFYSIIFVSINNAISYYYNQNFFVFSEADAGVYHRQSLIMASQSFFESIMYISKEWVYEDWGAFLVISTLYRVIASNLFVNFFYVIIGVFTALLLFNIGRKFMSVKFAYLCALTYSVLSFVLWFHSSGLKESLVVMLVVLFFDLYYELTIRKRKRNIIIMVIVLLSLLLFRPAVMLMLVGSVTLPLLFSSEKSIGFKIIVLILGSILFSYASNLIDITLNKHVVGGSVQSLIEAREAEGMVKGSIPFTYSVNILSGFFGPLPTLIPNTKTHLTFFSPGLIYRVFFSLFFWFGIYHIYKRKVYLLFPLILFVLMEVGSLVFILEALELRKSLPHIFAIFLISFWFIDFYHKDLSLSHKLKLGIKKLINFSAPVFFLIILFWNIRQLSTPQ